MAEPIARIVADADVLAADLLVGPPARAALDIVRAHSWVDLVASEPLLAETASVIEALATPSLASAWRSTVDELVVTVPVPHDDHPALATALHGDARHVLSFDPALQGAEAAVKIRTRAETSVKTPAQFLELFDPPALYSEAVGGAYPGPDRDPRG